VFRCLICIREGSWPPVASDVEETETLLMKQAAAAKAQETA